MSCIFIAYLVIQFKHKLYDRTVTVVARKRKFQIPAIPSTTSKSIRFPNDIIEEVENAIQGTTCTFSAFVVEATRLALEDLKGPEN